MCLYLSGESIHVCDNLPLHDGLLESCGFDACEHEYPSMSRHNRKVPVSFYHRFARDARQFADTHAKGKLVSVLEGGYSDRALMTGAMAHLVGLVDMESKDHAVNHEWWSLNNVVKVDIFHPCCFTLIN